MEWVGTREAAQHPTMPSMVLPREQLAQISAVLRDRDPHTPLVPFSR